MTPSEARIQRVALSFAMAFFGIGALGFVPGVTVRVDELALTDRHAGAALFGIITVSVLINLVHVASAVAGLVLARTVEGAQTYLVGGGIGYLALSAVDVVLGLDGPVTVAAISTADSWSQLGVGVTMIVLGIVLSPSSGVPKQVSAANGPPRHSIRH